MATSRWRAAAVAGAALLCQACALGVGAPVRPPGGALFTWVEAPLETNFSATPIGSKVGTSETRYLNVPNSYNVRSSSLGATPPRKQPPPTAASPPCTTPTTST